MDRLRLISVTLSMIFLALFGTPGGGACQSASSSGSTSSASEGVSTIPPVGSLADEQSLKSRWFIVVRHAEKASEPRHDPPLTEYGEARAQLLLQMLISAEPTTLLATELIRSQHTLEPLAAELGLLIDMKDSDDPYGMAAEAIRLDQPVTVISAHSDTVVPIMQGLTGQNLEHLGPIRYDDLFLVAQIGSQSSVLRLQYAPAGQ